LVPANGGDVLRLGR